MRLSSKNTAFAVLQAFAIAWGCVWSDAQTNNSAIAVSGTIDGLRLPLGYWPNGQLKSQLKAEKANVRENGPIYATNITSELFTVDGKLDIVMTAEDCTYDKVAKLATSDRNVRVAKKGVVISGTGFEWDSNEQSVKVLSNVVVVINRAMLGHNIIGNMTKGKKK